MLRAVACLERALIGAILAATLATLLLVALNGLLPVQLPSTFALFFWKWFAFAYVGVALAVALAAWGLGRITGRPGLVRLVLAGGAVLFLLVVAGSNRPALRSFVSLTGPAPFQWLVPATAGLCVLGLAVLAALPLERRWLPRLVALAVVASAASAFRPVQMPAAPAPETLPGPTRLPTAEPGLLVVGVDGADWEYMDTLLSRGELPNFAALRARGAWGPLQTLRPTLSPPLWTTMVTGKYPDEHGVDGFVVTRVDGVGAPLPDLAAPRAIAFPLLDGWLRSTRRVEVVPISGNARRVPALWNIAAAEGVPMGVVGWWATWPAEPGLGAVVSDRAYYAAIDHVPANESAGATHPEALFADVRRLVVPPEDIDFETARRFVRVDRDEWKRAIRGERQGIDELILRLPSFLSLHESTRRLAVLLLEQGRRQPSSRPSDLLVLFRLVDMVSHRALPYSELVADHSEVPEEDVQKLGEAVSEAYRTVDRALGDLVTAFGEGNVVVLSDHGFRVYSGHRNGGIPRGHHAGGPEGIFIGAGPAFRAGRVSGLRIVDVMPLLLYLKGFAIGKDMEGRLPSAALSEELLLRRAPRWVPSYGARQPGRALTGSRRVNDEVLDGLRALGYIH